jgi:hypothetical protein
VPTRAADWQSPLFIHGAPLLMSTTLLMVDATPFLVVNCRHEKIKLLYMRLLVSNIFQADQAAAVLQPFHNCLMLLPCPT